MAVIRFAGFLGANRAIEPKLLPESVLTVSQNQKPGRGDLRSWRNPVQVATVPAGRQSIYRMGRDVASDSTYWHSWTTVVNAVRGFSANDTTEQTFFTGSGAPKFMNNLTLDGTNPQDNPSITRPMGLPAPLTSLNSLPGTVLTDNVGKYQYMIEDANIELLTSGSVYRITVDDTKTVITLNEDPTFHKVTRDTLAAQLDAITGLTATAISPTSDEVGGVRVITDAVGIEFSIEKRTGTTVSYAWEDVTLTNYLSGAATGGTYTNVVLGSTISGSSMQIGNVYRINSVGTTDFVAVGAPNNNPMTIFTATAAATGTGTVDNVISMTSNDYALSVTITPAMIAAMEAGQRFSLRINAEQSFMVTVNSGSGTFPPAPTADSVKTAFSNIARITPSITSDSTTGARSVVLTLSPVFATSTLTVKKVTPGSIDQYETYATATEIKADQTSDVSTFYVYTYVNDLGWESAPSPVSFEDVRNPLATSTLSNFAQPPAGNYNITLIRIYKTQTGSNTNFYFLREIPINATTITDDNRDVGELLETTTWLPAPGVPTGGSLNTTEPNLTGLVPMWNGMMAGITGNAVRVCEPYTPYAWPAGYEVLVPDGKPVGLGVFGQNLLILTTSRPILVNGSSPDGLDQQKIEMPQACVSARSIVGMGSGVAWASEDGLCWFGVGGARLLTAGIMLREDWQAMNPSSIIGCMYEGLYFGSYLDGGTRVGFFIDPSNPQGIFFMEKGYEAMYFDELRDHLYVLDGQSVRKWDAAPDQGEWSPGGVTFMTYRVRSKVFKQPFPQSYAAAEVIASAYPVTFRLLESNNIVHTQTVTSRNPFRLPALRGIDYQIEIEGENPVQGVAIASTMKELAEV